MFELKNDESTILRSQNATTKFSMSRTNPLFFTEQGVYMLATILKSSVEANNQDTRNLLDKVIKVVSSMQNLQQEAKSNTRQIGFVVD